MKALYLILGLVLLLFSGCSPEYYLLSDWQENNFSDSNTSIYYNGTALYNGFEVCNTNTCNVSTIVQEGDFLHGTMFQIDQSTTVTISTLGEWYNISGFSSNYNKGFTYFNDTLTVAYDGTYLFDFDVSMRDGTSNINFHLSPLVNGVPIDCISHLTTRGVNDEANAGGSCVYPLSSNDIVTLGVANQDNTNNAIIESAALVVYADTTNHTGIQGDLTDNVFPIATGNNSLEDSSLSSSGTLLTTTENFKTNGYLNVNKLKITANTQNDLHFDSSPIGSFGGSMLFTVPNFFSTVAFKVPGGATQMGMTPGYGGGALTTSANMGTSLASLSLVSSGGFGGGYQFHMTSTPQIIPTGLPNGVATLGATNGVNSASHFGGLYLADDSPILFGTGSEWSIFTLDGTNLYFNHSGINNSNVSNTTNIVNFQGYVKAKGYLTNTDVWNNSKGDTQDYYKDSKELLNNGIPDDSLFPDTDVMFVDETIQNGTKLEWTWVYYCNGLKSYSEEQYNFHKDNPLNNCTKIYESYEIPNYIQVKKPAVSVSLQVAKHEQTIYDYTQNFRTYTNLTDFDNGVSSEAYYTNTPKFKASDKTDKNYFINKIKTKEEYLNDDGSVIHNAFDSYRTRIDKDGNTIYEIEIAEEELSTLFALAEVKEEMCEKNKNEWSWCIGKFKK